MKKEVKSLDELHRMVIALVRKDPELGEVEPYAPYWHERDSDGCNWDLAHWRGDNALVSIAVNRIRTDVMALRLRYDAEPKR